MIKYYLVAILALALCGIPYRGGAVEFYSQGAIPVPIGVSVITLTGSCPAGYIEDVNFRGRYIVGTPSGGTIAGTVDGAMSNLEVRAAGSHSHVERVGVANPPTTQTVPAVAFQDGSSVVSVVSTQPTGTSTSAAPYIQVLFCLKQ